MPLQQRKGKRRATSTAGDATGTVSSSMSTFMETVKSLFNLNRTKNLYDMQVPRERERLADDLWAGRINGAERRLVTANPDLNNLLNLQVDDTSEVNMRDRGFTDRVRGEIYPRFESVLTTIFRCRSMFTVPISTAAMAVRFHHHSIPRAVWDTVTYFSPGAVMSRSWTREFVAFAAERDPGCPYETIPEVTGACFDNFNIHSNYGSFSTTESTGESIDMVNWASLSIPKDAAPHGFNFDECLSGGGIFREDMDREEFIDLFSPVHPEILQGKVSRWSHYLDAAANGTFGAKPKFRSPYPPTHLHYHPPIYDQGNAKYVDINFQTHWFRTSDFHRFSKLLWLGCDGLAFMRLIHRIAQDPQLHLNTTPVVLPVLGEHPHSTFHIMDGGWKLYYPFIEVFTQLLNNKQIVSRPTVKVFNDHEQFLVHVIGRACAEYLVEIAATGADYHMPNRFMAQADSNFSFSIVVHFLFDYVFLYMQFRDSVRTNSSDTMDVCWREFLSNARSDLGNKTNYSVLTVVRVYWGTALVPKLAALYRNIRTLRLKDTHVGWDMFIERMNLVIRRGCMCRVDRESISKFIASMSFTTKVNEALEKIVHFGWSDEKRLKKMRADVDIIKEHLRKHVGATYAEATSPSSANPLDINLSVWGGSVAGQHMRNRPWQQAASSMRSYREYVAKQLAKLCHRHKWM